MVAPPNNEKKQIPGSAPSPTFPYLDDVHSGADDGQVRVSSARSKGSLQIFVVGVSVRRCSWLSFVVAISTSSFDLFGDKIQFL